MIGHHADHHGVGVARHIDPRNIARSHRDIGGDDARDINPSIGATVRRGSTEGVVGTARKEHDRDERQRTRTGIDGFHEPSIRSGA
jgi:hypothetical protein